LFCSDGMIDPKYFQSDSMPSRPVVSGGGSALVFAGSNDNFSRRVKDSMHPSTTTTSRPASQNAVDIQTRSAQSVQQPSLASSYFPARAS
jgi:hypothetical protein